MPADMQIVLICKEMGWTLRQYLESPQWFIDAVVEKMTADGEHYERQQKQYGKGQRT